jgi:hypothetical protein
MNKNLVPAIAGIVFFLLAVQAAILGGDFDVFLHAAQKLASHQDIYSPPFIAVDLQYYYSVFFALILIPFADLGFLIRLIWLILSLVMLYRCYIITVQHLDFSFFSKKQKDVWLLITLLLSFQFIRYNITMIQMTFFIVWVIMESFVLARRKKEIAAGALLGLAINIKLMPLVFLPYLFYRGYWKAVVTSLLIAISLLFIPSIFIGHVFNMLLLEHWWAVINPANKEHLFESGIGTHSLVALIPVYLTETIGDLPVKRNFISLAHNTVEMIIQASRVLLLALSLAYLKSKPFTRPASKMQIYWEASYFLVLIPLIMPHQQKYAFLLGMPLVAYLVYYFISTYKLDHSALFKICLATFALASLFFSPLYGSDIIGKYLFKLTQHYRLLTFAFLLLIPVSLYCTPARLEFHRLQKEN